MRRDKCPIEPETLNGNKDDDGCADPGAELVVIADANIELRERFTFKGSELRPGGPDLVKMVGLVLSGHPEFTLVRLEISAGTEAEAKGRGDAIQERAHRDGRRWRTAQGCWQGRPGRREDRRRNGRRR